MRVFLPTLSFKGGRKFPSSKPWYDVNVLRLSHVSLGVSLLLILSHRLMVHKSFCFSFTTLHFSSSVLKTSWFCFVNLLLKFRFPLLRLFFLIRTICHSIRMVGFYGHYT